MKKNSKIKKSIVLLNLMVITILFSCSDDIPKINRITSKEDLPSVSVDIFVATLTENGLIKGKLKAKRLEKYEDVMEPNIKFPKGISIVFYDEFGTLKSSLTADSAILYNKKEAWEAVGNVVFTNIEGQVLRTEHLYGDEKQQRIYTDEFVQITSSDGNIIKGAAGFESNSSFTIYEFLDVSGQIAIKDNPDSENKEGVEPETNNKIKKHNIPEKPVDLNKPH